MLKPTPWFAILLVLCFVTAAHAAQPEQSELNGDPIDARTYRAWSGNFRQLARYCSELEDDFLVVPNYNRRVPSSRGLTRAQATDELTVRWRETNGGLSQNRARRPDAAEAEAYAYGLPALDVGTYGYLHSVEIVEILGPEEMLVKDLWIVDVEAMEEDYDQATERARANGARNFREQLNQLFEHRLALKELQENEEVYEQTHRLVGYDTIGLTVGERWDGPEREGFQVAVARWEVPVDPEAEEGEDRPRRHNREEPRLVLVDPAPLMRETLDELGMMQLLDARGHTVTSFVEAMRQIRERFRDRDEAELRLVRLLQPPSTPEEE